MLVDQIDKRFGSIAVKRGFITTEQLIDALTLQVRENICENQHRLIGTILRELGYLSAQQIDEILNDML